ncbi:hypothetical protein [Myxosarcina sp. GI1]|uniref:hypothetical protein n=1 Tax=Myxosarcina sp. GI1 TaxID=1541065 RepID=UPI000A426692|nr:hypothetical protein [Myxosarcina sp. GI1]
MVNTHKNSLKSNHKHLKRKVRLRQQMDWGTPQVPLRKVKQQQQHELLSDWEHAS